MTERLQQPVRAGQRAAHRVLAGSRSGQPGSRRHNGVLGPYGLAAPGAVPARVDGVLVVGVPEEPPRPSRRIVLVAPGGESADGRPQGHALGGQFVLNEP